MRWVSTGHIAKRFGVKKTTVHAWRRRYDFPKPKTTDPYPQYDMVDIERWYARKWPDRSGGEVTIHRFRVTVTEEVRLTSTPFGPWPEARGYLKAVREMMFADWRVFSSPDGFSAHRGNEIEVWVLDPTSVEPEPWYVYDARLKATGRKQ